MDKKQDGKPEGLELTQDAPKTEQSKASAAKKEKLPTIEELAEKLELRPSILVGMKASFGWADGLAMSESDFLKAKDKWLKQPVNGRKVSK